MAGLEPWAVDVLDRGQRLGPSRDWQAPPAGVHIRLMSDSLTLMSDSLTLTAVFTPDENGWTIAQLAEWPAVLAGRPMLSGVARGTLGHQLPCGSRFARRPPVRAWTSVVSCL
jgi:hypothetical protein